MFFCTLYNKKHDFSLKKSHVSAYYFSLLGLMYKPSSRCSFDNDLYSEIIINIIINENGKALATSVFCNAINPPLYNRINATAACAIPHVILTEFGGVSEPFVVCIPSTNVAESAEVIKNVIIRINATMDKTIVQGNRWNTANRTCSSAYFDKSKIPMFCTFIAAVPNAANQTKLINEGRNSTPIKNSLIVCPIDTRAIHIPTNGDQEIPHAQSKIVQSLIQVRLTPFSGALLKLICIRS